MRHKAPRDWTAVASSKPAWPGRPAVTTLAAGGRSASAAENPYAEPAKPGLPPSNMVLNIKRAALVVTDPQIDFLSPKGVTWGIVGESVKQHNTVENLRRLFEAAKQADMTVAISPHYYYPTDKGWKFEGALEKLMHNIGMFDRKSPYTMDGFENSGADFMPEYKKYILDGKTNRYFTAQGLWPRSERSGTAASQESRGPGHSRRHVSEFVRRIPSA